MIEGRELTIYTDHKPITYALTKLNSSITQTPRRTRYLLLISEFTSNIRHVDAQNNVVADSLLRVVELYCPTNIDLAELAAVQERDEYIARVSNCSNNNSNVSIKKLYGPMVNKPIYYEISKTTARTYLPEKFRRIAFENIHNVSHPGINIRLLRSFHLKIV